MLAPMRQAVHKIVKERIEGVGANLRRITLILIAAVISALNMKTFIRAGDLFPGGFTGLTLLIRHVAHTYFSLDLPYSPVMLVMNVTPIVIGFKYVGRRFTLYTCLMVVTSSVLVDLFPDFAIIDDVLLCAVFGGIIAAFCGYLCLRAGASGGGTELIAIFISEKYGRDAWNYMLVFNAAILLVAGAIFGWERALYSIFFQFSATQLLNSIYKRYQKTTLLVITNRPDDVYRTIHEITNHDATVFKGKGCYQGAERDLVYSVVAADEVQKVARKIKEVDTLAFINILHSKQILGRFFLRPND